MNVISRPHYLKYASNIKMNQSVIRRRENVTTRGVLSSFLTADAHLPTKRGGNINFHIRIQVFVQRPYIKKSG